MKSGFNVILRPVMTEKAVRLLERENVLLIEVPKLAGKEAIAHAVKEVFGARVLGVRTQITWKGIKRAYVRLHHDTPAMDIITQLGLM